MEGWRGTGGFERRVKESSSNGQQAQALAGLILVKGSVCVWIKGVQQYPISVKERVL